MKKNLPNLSRTSRYHYTPPHLLDFPSNHWMLTQKLTKRSLPMQPLVLLEVYKWGTWSAQVTSKVKESRSCWGQSLSLVVLQWGGAVLSPLATEEALLTALLAVIVSSLSSIFTPGSLCAMVSHHPHCMLSLPHPPLTAKPACHSGNGTVDKSQGQ